MEQFQDELIRIKEILKNSPQGMSVTEIARTLSKNKHSVGHYLGILQLSGHVQMRAYGNAKVFSLSSRVPLDAMLGYTQDMILILDQDERIVRVNDSFLHLIQQDRSEVIGKYFSSLQLTESPAAEIIEQIRHTLKTDQSDTEISLKTQKEQEQFFRKKIIPTVFEDGKQGMIILLEDITAKKEAERALQASEEQFRLMAENLRDGIIIDENGRVIYANSRVEEIFGYSHAELSVLDPHDLAAPEERERVKAIIDEYMVSRNVPSDLTFWIIRKDGSRRYIYNRITAIGHDDSLIRYIVITDITEWKHAHDALENQLGFLQHMIDTFPNPLFYIDTYGRFLGCNLSFSRMIGRNFSEIAGKTSTEILLPADDAAVFDLQNEKLLKEPGILTYTGTISRPGGTRHTVKIQKSTFSTKGGALAGLVGLILADQEN